MASILTIGQMRTRNARRALAARGMLEAVTYSFIPKEHAVHFGGGAPELALANPIAADMSDMRPSLLPSLMAAAQRNADRGTGDVALFEVSHVYHGDKPEDQKRVAAGIRRGTAKREWLGPPLVRCGRGRSNVFDAKADALAALEAIGVDVSKVQVTNAGPDWYHPGRRGQIQLGPKLVLATFGEMHPLTLEALDAGGPMTGFEVWLDAVPEPKKRATRTKPKLELSGLQAVKRDFAFVLDKDKDAASLVRAASGADKKLISNVLVFDVFEGAAHWRGQEVAGHRGHAPAERQDPHRRGDRCRVEADRRGGGQGDGRRAAGLSEFFAVFTKNADKAIFPFCKLLRQRRALMMLTLRLSYALLRCAM